MNKIVLVLCCSAAAIIFGLAFTIAADRQNSDANIAVLNHKVESQKAEIEEADKNLKDWLRIFRDMTVAQVEAYNYQFKHKPEPPEKKTKAVIPTGYLDAANCDFVGGWANGPVDIYDGNKLIAKLSANLKRSDVGKHAFSISTPTQLVDGQSHYVNVRHAGTALLLKNGGRMIQCGNSPAHRLGVLVYRDGEWRRYDIE